MNMQKYLRIGLIVLLPFLITGCFNIIHYVNVGKDGKVHVRWRMSVSSALAEMGDMQGGPGAGGQKEPTLEENLADAKKEISESLKGLAEKVQVNSFENDQSQGIDVMLTLKGLAGLNANSLPKDEMPIVPSYDAKKKELVFRFTPESTDKLKGAGEDQEGGEEAPAESDESEETMSDSKAGDDAMGPDATEEDPMGGLEQLGDKIGQLFSSAASYDIIVGSGFEVKEAFARDSAGARGNKLEVIRLGEVNLIRFPLLGMISEDDGEDGFEIVVKMK